MFKKKTHKTIALAFAVDKGGVGKTTTTLNTAAGLALRGYRVLAIDADQQANLTRTLLDKPPETSLYDCLIHETIPLPRVEVRKNLDLVPASSKMFGIGIRLISSQMAKQMRGEDVADYRGILRRLIAPIRDEYDYILIDCPPSDNILMFNALFAADSVVIVSNPEPYCIDGARNFCEIIRTVRDSNHHLGLTGILVTDYETGSVGHMEAEKALRLAAPKHVFRTHIRHSRPIYNSVLAHKDIFAYDPKSIGAIDYSNYIDELITRTQK